MRVIFPIRSATLLLALFAAPVCGLGEDGARSADAPIDFETEVRPLLVRACVECHGPQKQEGGLRLDNRAAALNGGDSGKVVQPGAPGESELIRRVALPAGDPEIMPAVGDPLTGEQIELLRNWIEQGAVWPASNQDLVHWAYQRPERPTLPEVERARWTANPVDRFVLARLEERGLAPSPRADRETLIRRVTLDLIGLPPSPEDVDAFLNDDSPIAYEELVDRLLASDQFGVRWARPWLDYARYADSHGFQRDDFRDLWPYRDWVVDALNDDMPFDRFSVEQLAGDLLPNAAESQRIATGFNRSAPTNVEAGTEPEETRVNQIFDRVNTLGMVWLGSTLECCQCHDHKYDPFTMRDYYGLFAFFNGTEIEADRANPDVPGSIKFLGPSMPLTDPVVQRQRDALQTEIDAVAAELTAREAELQEFDAEWETELAGAIADAPQEHPLEVTGFESSGGAGHEVLDDRSILLRGDAPARDTYTIRARPNLSGVTAFKLEALTDPSLPGKGPGRGDAERPNFVLHAFRLSVRPTAGGEPQTVRFVAATADFSQKNYDVAGAIDQDPKSAWAIHPQFHKPHWAVFETEHPVDCTGESAFEFQLVQNHGGARTIGRLRLSAITGDYRGATIPSAVATALAVDHRERTEEQRDAVLSYRRDHDETYRELKAKHARLEKELAAIKPPTTLVMQEVEQQRANAVFLRGNYQTPGEPVTPSTPAILHDLDAGGDAAPTRMDLARWLVDPQNPLTARVTVNRWWAELFGHGLVTTPEDFGVKGERPTHPDLLDWLAVEFMESGWSMKHVLRTIVLSETYRQSSAVTPELLAADDQNLFYARGPRFRMSAEMVRDNALSIAGLLSLNRGGPPIKPYQPDGIWVKVGGQRYDYKVSPGEQRYRRGLYVVLKRGAPYPSFVNFDADNRMACRVKRPRSNTPLQALTLMNDPVYVEAAKAFAARILTERPEASDEVRIAFAMRVAVARPPEPAEVDVLSALLESQRSAVAADPESAIRLIGEFPLSPRQTAGELAAWYAVATAVLNLDETISKN